jgi:hypothetical protein
MRIYLRMALASLATAILMTALSSDLRAEEKVDPTGTWGLKVMIPGRPANESTLHLQKSGDQIVGTMTDFRGRSTPIKDAQLKDGELSFRLVFNNQGREFSFLYKGKLTADSFKGTANADFGGGRKFTLNFEGKRKKEDTTVAGSWKITLTLNPSEKLQPTIRLKQDGEKWSGEYISHSGKELPLKDVKVKGEELSFRTTEEFDDKKVPLAYSGKITGATMQGTVKLGTGSRVATFKFEAQKVQAPPANLAGTWKLRVPFKPDQTFEPTLKLAQKGISLSGTYVGEHGETPITDAVLIGDEFTFEVARVTKDYKYRLRFQGKVKGDTLTGSVEHDFDGVIGFLDFEGHRAK